MKLKTDHQRNIEALLLMQGYTVDWDRREILYKGKACGDLVSWGYNPNTKAYDLDVELYEKIEHVEAKVTFDI